MISIIRADNVVVKGGVAKFFDLSGLIDPEIHAVQFDEETGTGHIEYVGHQPPNVEISDMSPFQAILDAYEAA